MCRHPARAARRSVTQAGGWSAGSGDSTRGPPLSEGGGRRWRSRSRGRQPAGVASRETGIHAEKTRPCIIFMCGDEFRHGAEFRFGEAFFAVFWGWGGAGPGPATTVPAGRKAGEGGHGGPTAVVAASALGAFLVVAGGGGDRRGSSRRCCQWRRPPRRRQLHYRCATEPMW